MSTQVNSESRVVRGLLHNNVSLCIQYTVIYLVMLLELVADGVVLGCIDDAGGFVVIAVFLQWLD